MVHRRRGQKHRGGGGGTSQKTSVVRWSLAIGTLCMLAAILSVESEGVLGPLRKKASGARGLYRGKGSVHGQESTIVEDANLAQAGSVETFYLSGAVGSPSQLESRRVEGAGGVKDLDGKFREDSAHEPVPSHPATSLGLDGNDGPIPGHEQEQGGANGHDRSDARAVHDEGERLGSVSSAAGVAQGGPATVRCYLSKRHERVCTYAPLCFHRGQMVTSEGTRSCARHGNALAVQEVTNEADCEQLEVLNARESYMGSVPERVSRETLPEDTLWVRGDTSLIFLPRSAVNIAHFAGQMLYQLHFDLHGPLYREERTPMPVKILAAQEVIPHFSRNDSWHFGFTQAVLGTLDLPATVYGFEGLGADARVQTVSRDEVTRRTDESICYERALVAGFLKGRWTVNVSELPPHAPAVAEPSEHLLAVRARLGSQFVASEDENALRERTFLTLHQNPPAPTRKLVYLARERRREFNLPSEDALNRLLHDVATENNFAVEKVLFDGMTFFEQVDAVKSASIAVGLHGANLVNAFFMPVGAALLEIFPYQFDHDMYGSQSGSGLQYFRFNISEGPDFPALASYSDEMDCMRKSHDCKMHYRSDNRKVELSNADIQGLRDVLSNAFQAVQNLVA